MKHVLLLIHDDPGQRARLQASLDLTLALAGNLTCVDIVRLPVFAEFDLLPTDSVERAFDMLRAREAEHQFEIEEWLATQGVEWNWVDASGDIARVIARQADFADLIVLSTRLTSSDGPDMMGIISDIVMQSGRPVIAVPEHARGIDCTGHALIAWDGGHPVVETVRAAIPLLELASEVTLVQVGRIHGPCVEDAAAYLSVHGIRARIERVQPIRHSIADALHIACERHQPAYMMMGAYGHSRMRETLFGGVTRRMLGESMVPLILSH